MIKKVLKKILLVTFLIFLLLGITIFLGVMLPLETYKQTELQPKEILIKNCNIVDVKKGVVIVNRQILIINNRIVSIDSIISNPPKNIKTIELNGQYIMPSLWDMHLHTISLSPQLHFPLLIANGVTGVRDMGDGDSWISDIDDNSERDKAVWLKQVMKENLLMPKIIQAASFHLEDIKNITKDNYKPKIRELVSKLKARGEPFVKVQLENALVPNYIFYELQKEAKKQKIPILGHLSPYINIQTVLDNDFKSIEHAWALIPHFIKEKKTIDKDIEKKEFELSNQDANVTKEVLTKIAKKGTFYVPTHVTSNRKEYLAFNPDFNKSPNNIYVENMQLFLWKSVNWLHTKGYDIESDLPVLENYYHLGLQTTKLANKYGVKMLTGTDALDRNVHYGISIHEEMQELVKAGLSNAEALKAATYNAADYYGVTNDFGSIEVGRIADFIVLSENPIENIKNTKSIKAVYYNKRFYDSEDLKDMKKFVENQAKSFGITCKFIWNMMKLK